MRDHVRQLKGTLSMDSQPDDQLEWRDTYFILFDRAHRPSLAQVKSAISETSRRLQLSNLEADPDGMFESMLVHAPQDNAALEISYESGEAVVEQSADLAKQLGEDLSAGQLKQMRAANARLDVMLFERVSHDAWSESAGDEEDDLDAEALDPASLLGVVEALAKLTKGLPIDPASGGILP